MRTVTYLTIRPAAFTCWPLLVCLFLSSIFLYFPIDFLFADFTIALLYSMIIPQKYLVVKDILCAKITYIGQIDTPVTY